MAIRSPDPHKTHNLGIAALRMGRHRKRVERWLSDMGKAGVYQQAHQAPMWNEYENAMRAFGEELQLLLEDSDPEGF